MCADEHRHFTPLSHLALICAHTFTLRSNCLLVVAGVPERSLSNGNGGREAVQNLIRLRILSNSWPTRLKPTQPPPLRLTLPSPSGFFRPPSLSALHSVARLRPIGRPPAHAQRPPHCFAARFPPSQIRNCPRLCQCTQGACHRCCRTVSPYRRRSIPLVHTTERRYSNWLQRQTETA